MLLFLPYPPSELHEPSIDPLDLPARPKALPSPMTKNCRVFNLTRKFSMKGKQALHAVEQCACAWVEYGISVRDLTLAESIAKRNEQAAIREPLAAAEIPGLIYEPPAGKSPNYQLINEANRYCAEHPNGHYPNKCKRCGREMHADSAFDVCWYCDPTAKMKAGDANQFLVEYAGN